MPTLDAATEMKYRVEETYHLFEALENNAANIYINDVPLDECLLKMIVEGSSVQIRITDK